MDLRKKNVGSLNNNKIEKQVANQHKTLGYF